MAAVARTGTATDKVRLTFASGASLEDPAGLFNASLGGKVRRAIDLRQGDELDEEAFKDLVRAATRSFHVHEGDELDEEQFASWVQQASRLPGWVP